KYNSNHKENIQSIPNAFAATQVVKVDEQYQSLLEALLENVYIFDGSMDDFRYDEEYDKYTFLSKTGTFIKSLSSMSGGSVGLFEGKRIGRKKNFENIEKQLASMRKDKSKLEVQLSEVTAEINTLKNVDYSGKVDAKL